MLDQKPPSVLFGKDTGKAPRRILQVADVEEIDDQQISGFGPFNRKGSAQIMYLSQVNIANVVGAVIGSNLPSRPIEAFNPEFGPWL